MPLRVVDLLQGVNKGQAQGVKVGSGWRWIPHRVAPTAVAGVAVNKQHHGSRSVTFVSDLWARKLQHGQESNQSAPNKNVIYTISKYVNNKIKNNGEEDQQQKNSNEFIGVKTLSAIYSETSSCVTCSNNNDSIESFSSIQLYESIQEVIAFICGNIVIILMIMALASTDWLMAAGWRQGLFIHCIGDDAPTPLPFNIQDPPDCYQARDVAYIRAAAGLCIVTLLTDIFATLMTGLGLRSKDHRTKYKYYRVAVYIMLLSLVSLLLALIIYPVCFANELKEGNRTVWEFGWAYGVGWGAAIFLFGGVILLLCDKESEEIYYKERKIVHDSDSRA